MRYSTCSPLRAGRRAALAALVLAAACDRVREAVRPEPPTAWERYALALRAAGLDNAALGREWLAAGDSALRAPVPVTPPWQEEAHFDRSEARAVAYRVPLRDGERITVTVAAERLDARLFVDAFRATGDTALPFVHHATAVRDTVTGAESIVFEAARDGDYLIRVQPELLRSGRYVVRLVTGPSLAFPVAGHTNRAVMSGFGADRDAGRRRHHGIDIFAPRGTPVLAAADGIVRSTEPNDLGGNVVWLRDPVRGLTLYYAHLQETTVAAGTAVRVGDTLGFVGNTGNARGTRPHLHFGVYRRGQGPIDPFPHVKLVTASPVTVAADASWLGGRGTVRARDVALRRSPRARADTVRTVASGDTLRLIAASGDWYRVLGDDGVAGYVPARLVSRARATGPRGRTAASDLP